MKNRSIRGLVAASAFVAISQVFAVSASTPAQAASKPLGTCSGQNSICYKFCAGSGRGETCTTDCASRQIMCLRTGTYPWINSPSISGLIRK